MSNNVIVVDVEGTPVQEIAAMAISGNDIVSAFHIFPYANEDMVRADDFARKHVHGIPLVKAKYGCLDWWDRWTKWRSQYTEHRLIANDARKEADLFQEPVDNYILTPWDERYLRRIHIMAEVAKECGWALCGISWARINHSAYINDAAPKKLTPSKLARLKHGHHCAFYDVLEVAAEFVLKQYSNLRIAQHYMFWDYDDVGEFLCIDGRIKIRGT